MYIIRKGADVEDPALLPWHPDVRSATSVADHPDFNSSIGSKAIEEDRHFLLEHVAYTQLVAPLNTR